VLKWGITPAAEEKAGRSGNTAAVGVQPRWLFRASYLTNFGTVQGRYLPWLGVRIRCLERLKNDMK